MSDRGAQLMQAADSQITELTALLGARDEAALSLPCPGREKLGDGTVAACAAHTAGNYLRIAAFIAGEDHEDHAPVTHGPGRRDPHRIPSFLRGRRHAAGHDASRHSAPPGAGDVDRRSLLDRLSAARDAFAPLANLTDEQLDTVPAASDMRFCDGQRTLEQIVTSLLNHQSHQVAALRAALA